MNYKLRVATIISRLFDPFIMLAVVCIILLSHTAVFIPAFISMVIVPLALFFIAWKTKFVSNWDITDRSQRPKLFWPLIVVETISIVVFHLWTLMPILIAMIGFAVITQFWKISGHAFASALATGILILRFGWQWWPVLFIVPLVVWSRVVRKNHTIPQVIVGALYGWVIIWLYAR